MRPNQPAFEAAAEIINSTALRRAVDRLRGGPDAAGGAGRTLILVSVWGTWHGGPHAESP
jgi:hypothetical protein